MADIGAEIDALVGKVKSSQIPSDLLESIVVRLEQIKALSSSPSFLPEFDRTRKYTDWVLSVPWDIRTQDILDLTKAREVMDKHHHGLGEIKDRVLEYISVMKLKQIKGEENQSAPILFFIGLVGTGKTTIASSIAESLGRKFVRIPFGGMGSALDLRGQSRLHAEAEPGKVIKSIIAAGSMNPVILLDEIDRVTDRGRASIMGVLVELLDPEQNHEFIDHYIDRPVDLSEVLFIATANNSTNIATAVLDRLEPIAMPSYADMEKIIIGKDYLLPRIMKESGLSEGALRIDESVWPNVVRPLGYDAGIRTLERTIEGIARKTSRMIVEGKAESVTITPENIKEYLPR